MTDSFNSIRVRQRSFILVGLLAMFTIIMSCNNDTAEVGQGLLVSLNFEGDDLNGLDALNTELRFVKGIKGKGLDLGVSSVIPPLDQLGKEWFSIDKDFSISIWVKSEHPSNDTTIILSNADFRKEDMGIYGKRRTNKGFAIYAANGGWGWNIGNSKLHYNYEPVPRNQPIADDTWHQIAFTYNAILKEARLYYDGVNKAILGIGDLKNVDFASDESIVLGQRKEMSLYKSFLGAVDELRVWESTLSIKEVKELYKKHKKLYKAPTFDKEELTVLNWNIWHGGTHYLKERDGFDGVERTIEMIKEVGADIVLMQETYGAGSKISSSLDYYYYEASSTIGAVWGANLSVMSRYPIEDVYLIEERSNYGKNYAFNNGGAKIRLTPDKKILAFTNWYNGRKPEDLDGALTGWKDLLDDANNIPHVWAGDYNSVSHLDDGLGESGHSKLMVNAGFKDAYREIYPNAKKYPCYTAPRFEDRIDYIYYKGNGLELVAAGKIREDFRGRGSVPGYPSDHLGITAKFKVK